MIDRSAASELATERRSTRRVGAKRIDFSREKGEIAASSQLVNSVADLDGRRLWWTAKWSIS